MGVLERVLDKLRQAGFRAELAFPGQKHTAVTGAVAAVHIETVDRAASVVTVAVNIHSPGKLGGTACEVEGLRAMEILHADGAACTMHGCTYDGMTGTFGVSILAAYTGLAGMEGAVLGLGFSVRIGESVLPYAVEFSAEESRENGLRYAMGEREPQGVSLGRGGWVIRLVEVIPAGAAEVLPESGEFSLEVMRSGGTEVYRSCVWTTVKREFTREGLRCTRTGLAVSREVS